MHTALSRTPPWVFVACIVAASARVTAVDVPVEDYQRLLQRVAHQEAAIESFRTTLQDLRVEVVRMRSTTEQLKTLANAPRPFATTDQLRQVAEQVRSVERNRVADRQQILLAIEGLRGLAKSSAAMPSTPGGSPSRPKAKGATKGAGKGKAPQKVPPPGKKAAA